MQTGNFWIDLILAQISIGIIPLILLIVTIAMLLSVVIYLIRFTGIGTALFYVSKGNTLRIFSADEDEKVISAGGRKKYTFSKISEGKHAAQPIIYHKRFRPRRAFLAIEGHPTIISWSVFTKKAYPLPKFTAQDLNSIVDGVIAKGLAKALITAVKSDWIKILMGAVIGFLLMGVLYPFIFRGG